MDDLTVGEQPSDEPLEPAHLASMSIHQPRSVFAIAATRLDPRDQVVVDQRHRAAHVAVEVDPDRRVPRRFEAQEPVLPVGATRTA